MGKGPFHGRKDLFSFLRDCQFQGFPSSFHGITSSPIGIFHVRHPLDAFLWTGIILLAVITACCLDLHHDKEKSILPYGGCHGGFSRPCAYWQLWMRNASPFLKDMF
jgi:hypothetical protein